MEETGNDSAKQPAAGTVSDTNGDTAVPAEELDRRVAAAAMRIAVERGWLSVGLIEVARAAGVSLSTFYRHYPARSELLAAVSRVADATVLAADIPPDPQETARDRLFDVMMRRFDALLPYRDGLRAVLQDLSSDPVSALCFTRQYGRSMAWMLRAAGIEVHRRGGAALVAGLGGVQARVMRVFLADDSPDLSRTMAALDRELKRAERWSATLCRWRGPAKSKADAPAAAAI